MGVTAIGRIFAVSISLLLMVLLTANKSFSADKIVSFKDQHFAYPNILKEADKGHYKVIDYNEMRDVNGRDVIPAKRVKDAYVSLKIRSQQQDLIFNTSAGPVKAVAVGGYSNAPFIVIYLHGRGGNRHQGVNDYSFGGNFNRVKNLVVQSGGLYISPDFADFETKGKAEIAGLIHLLKANSPKAKIILACGSAGGAVCWQVIHDKNAGKDVSGMILLGSLWDDAFIGSQNFKKRMPLFIAHGSRDPVFSIDSQESFYKKIRKTAQNYPVQFRRFESGNHGTPIRMADWREMLNWILAQSK